MRAPSVYDVAMRAAASPLGSVRVVEHTRARSALGPKAEPSASARRRLARRRRASRRKSAKRSAECDSSSWNQRPGCCNQSAPCERAYVPRKNCRGPSSRPRREAITWQSSSSITHPARPLPFATRSRPQPHPLRVRSPASSPTTPSSKTATSRCARSGFDCSARCLVERTLSRTSRRGLPEPAFTICTTLTPRSSGALRKPRNFEPLPRRASARSGCCRAAE
jgi:hypothetical protein